MLILGVKRYPSKLQFLLEESPSKLRLFGFFGSELWGLLSWKSFGGRVLVNMFDALRLFLGRDILAGGRYS